jgi:S-adenosylmethionine decarboxylase
MAYSDTLFQLGMDLTRSSTAQKEDHGETAHVAHTAGKMTGTHPARNDDFIERNGVRYAGNHLLIDVFGAKGLENIEHIEQTLKRCAEVAGATVLHVHLRRVTPNNGVAGVAVLAESHISAHTWPEANYAAFDVFMCGDTKPERCVEVLMKAFDASDVVVKPVKRGEGVQPIKVHAMAAVAKRSETATVRRSANARTKVRKAA